MSETHVWLHNPETDGTWQCPAELVDLYVEQRGWERCDPPAEDHSALYDAGDPRAQVVAEPAVSLEVNPEEPHTFEPLEELDDVCRYCEQLDTDEIHDVPDNPGDPTTTEEQ